MFNPLQRLQDILSPKGRSTKLENIHPAVGWYEFASVVLTIPSMLIFIWGFILVAFNVSIAKQIGKGKVLVPFICIPIVNFAYIPLAIVFNRSQSDVTEWSLGVVIVVPLSLILLGYSALYLNRSRMA